MSDNFFKIHKGVNLSPQAGDGSNPTDGDVQYNSTLNKFRAYQNGAWVDLISSGSGGINHIDNPDFENDASGYAAYADAAATTPVDGTGGSPNVTITRSTSSPLRGDANGLITKDAANRQGEGVSYDFSIDSADQAKPLVVSFDYEDGGSFAYNAGTAASPSDIMIYLYDVTNAVLIHPILSGLDGSGRFVSNFLTAVDSTSYRLIFHVATTNASAWTLKIDNISVGPGLGISLDGPITDWQSYTPTITSFGTATNVDFKYRRVGDSAEVMGTFTSGTVAGTVATISLPGGLLIDTTKVLGDQKSMLGSFFGSVNTTATGIPATSRGPYVVTYDAASASTVAISQSVDLDDQIFTPGLGNGVGTSNTNNAIRFTVPISGWSTGLTTGIAVDSSRPVVASFALTSSTANASFADGGGAEIIDFDSKLIDTHGAVTTGASWKFTAPVTGYYRISARFGSGGEAVTVNDTFALDVYKNNALFISRFDFCEHEATASNINTILVGTSIVSLVAGDFIDFRMATAGAGAVTPANTNNACMADIEKIDSGISPAALFNTNKWQRKQLASNVTTDVTISDAVDTNFKFDNLIIGKTYELLVSTNWTVLENDESAALNISNGGTTILSSQSGAVDSATASDTQSFRWGNTVIFIATATTIRFATASLTSGTILNSGIHTFAILTERNDLVSTTEWT